MAIGAAEIIIEINLTGMEIERRYVKFEEICKLLSQGLKEDNAFLIDRKYEELISFSGKVLVGKLYVAAVRISRQEKDWFDHEFKAIVSGLCGSANIRKFECSWLT